MTIALGNAAAPRWWDLEPARLPAYLDHVHSHGATMAEVVLHHGPADDRTARVHALEDQWEEILAALKAAEMAAHLHASLDERFHLIHWRDHPEAVRTAYEPILRVAAAIGEHQVGGATITVHGCDGNLEDALVVGDAARGFLHWAQSWLISANANARIGVELRDAHGPADRRPDRSRDGLLQLIRDLDPSRIGICWDVGHDWENRQLEPGWTAMPTQPFLDRVIHLHLHDAGTDGSVHHPLVRGIVPWREQLAGLLSGGYADAITMEIRYRHAKALGDPWQVLAETYDLATHEIAQFISAGAQSA